MTDRGSASKSAAAPSSRPGPNFGEIERVFDDVWWAYGTTRMGPGVLIPRTMVILRERGDLVLIHPVMMPDAQQSQLEALGPVKHIVRLGSFHGMDDLAYVQRYAPTVWAPPLVDLKPGIQVHHELVPGGDLPIANAALFKFESSRVPEVALLLNKHDGVLLACDSVQNWEHTTGCSAIGSLVSRLMGFRGRACIGPQWLKAADPENKKRLSPDFERLLKLNFRHAIGGHGGPILDTARDDLRLQVRRAFG